MENWAECPSSPNCVSTTSSDAQHRINPITFTGLMENTREKLIQTVGQLPRTRLVTEKRTTTSTLNAAVACFNLWTILSSLLTLKRKRSKSAPRRAWAIRISV